MSKFILNNLPAVHGITDCLNITVSTEETMISFIMLYISALIIYFL